MIDPDRPLDLLHNRMGDPLTLRALRAILALQGLSVVTASGIVDECAPLDTPPGSVRRYLRPGEHVVSAADKAVLDWAARLSVAELGLLRGDERDQSEASIGFARAELARREAKP
jgi:hypothetical protein